MLRWLNRKYLSCDRFLQSGESRYGSAKNAKKPFTPGLRMLQKTQNGVLRLCRFAVFACVDETYC